MQNRIIPERKDITVIPAFEDLTQLLFGIQGSGKTSFFNGDKNSVVASLEAGSGFMASRPVEVKSWVEFQALVNEVAGNSSEISGLNIDTVDALYDLCLDYVCSMKNISYPPEDFGKTWMEITKEFYAWLNYAYRYTSLRFISHLKTVKITEVNQTGVMEEMNTNIQRFDGKKAMWLDASCALVGFISSDPFGCRVVTYQQSQQIATKDRTGLLAPMGNIKLPNDPKESFDFLANVYNTEAKKRGLSIQKRENY